VVDLVSDAELVERNMPALKSKALKTLMSRLPLVHPKEEPLGSHAGARTAGDVMTRTLAKIREELLRSEGIALMLRQGQRCSQ